MPAEPLLRALMRVRALVLDDATLVRAVASGRQKGETPAWKRVELRWVDLKAGRRLQVVKYDETQAHTSNHAADGDLAGAGREDPGQQPPEGGLARPGRADHRHP